MVTSDKKAMNIFLITMGILLCIPCVHAAESSSLTYDVRMKDGTSKRLANYPNLSKEDEDWLDMQDLQNYYDDYYFNANTNAEEPRTEFVDSAPEVEPIPVDTRPDILQTMVIPKESLKQRVAQIKNAIAVLNATPPEISKIQELEPEDIQHVLALNAMNNYNTLRYVTPSQLSAIAGDPVTFLPKEALIVIAPHLTVTDALILLNKNHAASIPSLKSAHAQTRYNDECDRTIYNNLALSVLKEMPAQTLANISEHVLNKLPQQRKNIIQHKIQSDLDEKNQSKKRFAKAITKKPKKTRTPKVNFADDDQLRVVLAGEKTSYTLAPEALQSILLNAPAKTISDTMADRPTAAAAAAIAPDASPRNVSPKSMTTTEPYRFTRGASMSQDYAKLFSIKTQPAASAARNSMEEML